MPPEVNVFDVPAELFNSAARTFADLANHAVAGRGKFLVALSGGSTPRKLFEVLRSLPPSTVPWEKVYFFWGDERHVPPDSPESNYRMADEVLLSKIPARPENIFRIHAEEKDAEKVAYEYEEQIRKFFDLSPGEPPKFDLILLGLGPEGHTASLFPGTTALSETKRLVVPNWVEKLHTARISFTFPVINNSSCVMFLVTGKDKAPAVQQVFAKRSNEVPASLVHPSGRLIWMLDRDAAADLPKPD
jgi:6-phosphogluconolactonase